MDSDDRFAHWAALFSDSCRKFAATLLPNPPPSSAAVQVQYVGVTAAACRLLQAVDGGGVPAFVTKQLQQIAAANGIEVASEWTPNEVIAALRAKASDGAAERSPAAD